MNVTRFSSYPASRTVVLVHGGAGEVPEASRAAHAAGCLAAARVAHALLLAGGSALDAVCAAVRVLEDDPRFNAGTGASLDASGALSLDAAVMDGRTLRAGAVACLPPFRHPIDVARRLVDESESGGPVLLASGGARAFAEASGFVAAPPESMITELAKQKLAEAKRSGISAGFAGGTVGAVARAADGSLAAATSTGGKSNKPVGRIGDSPLPGAGTYADDTLGACSGTGDGEAFMRLVLAHRAVTLLERDPRAAERAIGELGSRLGALGGLLLVSPRGEASFARNTVTMGFAVVGEGLEDSGT